MTNVKNLSVLAIAGALLTTGVAATAFADDHGSERSRDGAAAFQAGERFARADVDGDRMISLEEFQGRVTARFETLDADSDGLVTPAEMVAARERAQEDRAAQRMARADANEDGALSLEEMVAASEQRFARMDRNDDGTLEGRELRRGFEGRGQERGERDAR